MRSKLGAMVLCAAVLAGCSGTTMDGNSARLLPSAPSFSRGGGDQHRATGSATIILPMFDNAQERYSLSAIQRGDGTVSGEFEEYSEQDGGQRIPAQVYCLTVSGNTARLAARIDQTNVSFGPPGSYVIWSVIDNGEGAKAPPDQTTDIFFGATQAVADRHCQTGINLAPYFSSLRGNLQVE